MPRMKEKKREKEQILENDAKDAISHETTWRFFSNSNFQAFT